MLIDVIQKKAADIKKCIIEESNETHKVLEENLEQQKNSQIHATTAIMKNFNESIAKQTTVAAKKTAPPPSQKSDNFRWFLPFLSLEICVWKSLFF